MTRGLSLLENVRIFGTTQGGYGEPMKWVREIYDFLACQPSRETVKPNPALPERK